MFLCGHSESASLALGHHLHKCGVVLNTAAAIAGLSRLEKLVVSLCQLVCDRADACANLDVVVKQRLLFAVRAA
jgi:hypothetical protein